MWRAPYSRTWRQRLGTAAVLGGAALSATQVEARAETNHPVNPKLAAAQPPGFDTLLGDQEQVVDVYYGDVLRGQATAIVGSGLLRFADPDAVLAMLPDVSDRVAVRATLARPLQTNADRLCERAGTSSDHCGRLSALSTGVVYDSRIFRVDIFVAPSLRSVAAMVEPRYLTPTGHGISSVDLLAGTVAGSGRDSDYTVQNRLVIARGDARIRADLTYSGRVGVIADTLVAEVDKARLRYRAGEMWTPGLDLLGERKMVGIGLATQLDTRADREVLSGTPLIVSLYQRSRVDILREGRLVSSQICEAGSQALDTSGLPDGSYDLTLRVQEASGAVHEERRFFSKNSQIPADHQRFYFAYAGLLADDRVNGFLRVSDRVYGNAGLIQRLSHHVAVAVRGAATERAGIVEAGGLLFWSLAQVRGSVLVSSRGDHGVIVQALTTGTRRLTLSLDARRVWSVGTDSILPYGSEIFQDGSLTRYERAIQTPPASYSQVGLQAFYQVAYGQVGFLATYRQFGDNQSYYSLGPSANIPLIERSGIQVALRGDLSFARNGHSGFVGLSLFRTGQKVTFNAAAGVGSNSGTGSDRRVNAVGGIGASWQGDGVAGGTLGVSGGVDRDVLGTSVRGRADLKTAPVAVYTQLVQPIDGVSRTIQYNAGFATAIAFGGNKLGFDGRSQNDSALVIGVAGSAGDSKFDVIVNGASRGMIASGGTLTVSVPAYRRYEVRIRPVGDTLLRFDGRPRTVTTYPGTVAKVGWAVHPVAALFGRLAWPDGSPVSLALLTTADAVGQTDEHGFFEIESTIDATVNVRTQGGRPCSFKIDAQAPHGFADLGQIVCQPPLPGVRIAGRTP